MEPQGFAGPSNDGVVCIVGQHFCAPYPVELTVQKKVISLSGGDFTVTDYNGNAILRVDGRVLSLRDKRVLQDISGNPLVTMKAKILTIHRKWEAFRGDNSDAQNLLFSAKKSSLFQLKTSLDVFMASNTQQQVCDFKVKGSYLERSCTIYQGSRVIAEMKRKYTVANILLGKDTFAVTVHPGVDFAFIVALIVILHEINRDGNDHD
eukprot:Gb_02701 [translate_table: standard]